MQREHAGFPVVLHNTRRAIDILKLQQPGVRAAVGVDQTVHAEVAVMRPLIVVAAVIIDAAAVGHLPFINTVVAPFPQETADQAVMALNELEVILQIAGAVAHAVAVLAHDIGFVRFVVQIFLNAFERRVHIAEHINVREIVCTVLAAVLGALVVGQAAGVKTLCPCQRFLERAVAGFDIEQLVAGAADMEKACGADVPFAENPAAIYAATRNELYRNGKKIEILVNFCPKLHYVSEWWKQLYGESEGKDNKGIFPASVDFSTDLHSMGQWIQEGERSIFETVISLDKVDHKLEVPSDEANLDGLNFLAGKRVDEVNKMAELGTQLAHVDGGVPNMRIVLPSLSEYNIGSLLYFFEKACGISGYLLGVNPFNQPGVEAYKKNMFALLNKPGYEEESKAIQSRL